MSVLQDWHVYSSINCCLVSQETFVFCTFLFFLFCFHFTYWLVFGNRTPQFGLRKRFDLKYVPSSDPALWQISGVAILQTNAIARCVQAQMPKDVNTSHTTDRGRRTGPPVRSLLYTVIFIKRKRCPLGWCFDILVVDMKLTAQPSLQFVDLRCSLKQSQCLVMSAIIAPHTVTVSTV